MAASSQAAATGQASVSAVISAPTSNEAPPLTPKISRLFSFLNENVLDERHGTPCESAANDYTYFVAPVDGYSVAAARTEHNADSTNVCARDSGREFLRMPSHTPPSSAKTLALRQKIAALELLVEEKQQQLLEMKKMIAEQENEKLQIQQQMEKQCKAEIARYEEAVERQQKMVSKLLADKEELTKKCDAFAEQTQQAERNFEDKLEEVRRRCEKEAEKQHRTFVNAERARRETWQREKTQDIKEMTIKGLEPEIQRLMDRHRDDKKRMEETMRRAIEELQSDYQEKLQLVKETVARDEDENLERERAHHRRLMREQHEQFEKELRNEREKQLAEQTEKEKQWELQRQTFQATAEQQVKVAVKEEQARRKQLLKEFEKEAALLQQQHSTDLEAMRQHADQKEVEWQSKLEKKVDEETARRLEHIKEELKQERDKKLDLVIEKMGREQLDRQQQQRQMMQEAVERTRCELNEQLKVTLLQNEKLKAEIQAKEAEREVLEARISNLEAIRSDKHEKIIECEARIEAQTKQAREAIEEKDIELQRLTTTLRLQQENHTTELRAKEEDCLRLKRNVCEAQEQIEKVKKENDQQLEVLEAKIKQALWVKDEVIRDLKEEMAGLETKVAYFRDQQRKHREDMFRGSSQLTVLPVEDGKQTASTGNCLTNKEIATKPNKKNISASKSCTPTADLTTAVQLVEEEAKNPPHQHPSRGRIRGKKDIPHDKK